MENVIFNDSGEPIVATLGVRVRVPGQKSQGCFYEQIWLFELYSQKQYEEFSAACNAVAENVEGHGVMKVNNKGVQDNELHYQINARSESESNAKMKVNHASIHFAALHQWGCGPIEGVEKMNVDLNSRMEEEASALRVSVKIKNDTVENEKDMLEKKCRL